MSKGRHRLYQRTRKYIAPTAAIGALILLLITFSSADAATRVVNQNIPNYAGYALGTTRAIDIFHGDFVVPAVDCSKKDSAFSTWVGIGAFDGPLVQAGVDACDGPNYVPFYEVKQTGVPNRGSTFPNAPTSLFPGQRVRVAICPAQDKPIDSANHYQCKFNAPANPKARISYYVDFVWYDKDGPHDASTIVTASGLRHDGECIVEAPKTPREKQLPLAGFTPARFYGCGGVYGGKTTFGTGLEARGARIYKIDMVNRGKTLATTSPLDGFGGFTVTRAPS